MSSAWFSMEDEARLQALRDAVAAITSDFRVESADKRGEVILSSTLPEEPPAGEEGAMLMTIEAALREKLAEPLEVYFQQRADENKPRQNREVIMEWIERREELRRQGSGGQA